MTIRDRLFTRDIAHAARERQERLRDEEVEREHRPAATVADAPAATVDRQRVPEAESPLDRDDRRVASADEHAIFPGDEASGFRSRWEAIQTGFVDEPRKAVEQADALVAQVVTRLAEVFSDERAELERQWDRGDNTSTEDLRIALTRYRAFFTRLLSV